MNRFLTLLLLLLVSSTLHAQDMATGQFIGDWANRDLNTRNITRVSLKMANTDLMVQMWGKCQSQDCDWGMVRATVNDPDADGPSLKVIWEHGFKAVIQTLRLGHDGQLHVSSLTHYTDQSGRKDRVETEIFTRTPQAAK